MLVKGLHVRHVVVGYHFFLAATAEEPRKCCVQSGRARAGFGVTVVGPVADSGDVATRPPPSGCKLAEGNVKGAAEDLRPPAEVEGRVVGGASAARASAFRLAKIPMPKGTALGHGHLRRPRHRWMATRSSTARPISARATDVRLTACRCSEVFLVRFRRRHLRP